MNYVLKILFAVIVICLSACTEEDKTNYRPVFSDVASDGVQEYRFGFHPMHNPQRLHEIFSPIVDYLNSHVTGGRFVFEGSRDFSTYNQKLYSRQFHFSMPNPYQTINAIDKGYKVFAKLRDDDNFRGVIVVRKDSGIKMLSDLVGKSVSYPAPSALAATLMPQYYFQTHGINVTKELDNQYVGSQESAVMNVYLKQTAAGATWTMPWQSLAARRPELLEELEVIWQTDALISSSLVVLPDVPVDVVAQVTELLTGLKDSNEGRLILERMKSSGFEIANNQNYDAVREFVRQFEAKVRPIEMPQK